MMTRPCSMDLRERVVAAIAEGQSRRSVARLFRLGEATVIRWAKRHISTGSVAAKAMGGIRHDVVGAERVWLRARMAAVPDLTVRALRAELLAERGLRVSYDAVWRFRPDEGLAFKKSPRAAEQDRPDMARKRERWKRYQGQIDPARLVFVDEIWTKTNMTRTRGRAMRGQRLVAAVPHSLHGADFHGRSALQRHRRTLRVGWTDQRRKLPRLGPP